MNDSNGVLVQIGGSGKGCGKTSLIEALLRKFSGAVYVKSALHSQAASPHGGDDIRCHRSGAAESRMFGQEEIEELRDYIHENVGAGNLVFFEKNRIDEQLKPDLYFFLDVRVDRLRSDHTLLRQYADYIVTTLDLSEELILEMDRLIREKQRCV